MSPISAIDSISSSGLNDMCVNYAKNDRLGVPIHVSLGRMTAL